jgi:hypothetical protein
MQKILKGFLLRSSSEIERVFFVVHELLFIFLLFRDFPRERKASMLAHGEVAPPSCQMLGASPASGSTSVHSSEGLHSVTGAVEEPSPAFLCPIMGDVMSDPVICTDGHSYDRSSITRWLAEHNTSPATGMVLESNLLIPNIALRNAIEEWEDLRFKARSSRVVPTANRTEDLVVRSEASAEEAWTANDAPGSTSHLRPGMPVMYVDAQGAEVPAQVLAVHAGGAEDPEPFYTIALQGGAERETVPLRPPARTLRRGIPPPLPRFERRHFPIAKA